MSIKMTMWYINLIVGTNATNCEYIRGLKFIYLF